MTTKEKYTLDDGEWVTIDLETFKALGRGGYHVERGGGGQWGTPLIEIHKYQDWDGPFRTKRSEFMKYLGSGITQRSTYKSRPDLLPSEAVLSAGRVLAFGLEKHPDELWKTLSVEDHVAASLRHIYQHQNGPDPETGESHLAHALCRLAFAIARGAE
jgi:hypothetical protein